MLEAKSPKVTAFLQATHLWDDFQQLPTSATPSETVITRSSQQAMNCWDLSNPKQPPRLLNYWVSIQKNLWIKAVLRSEKKKWCKTHSVPMYLLGGCSSNFWDPFHPIEAWHCESPRSEVRLHPSTLNDSNLGNSGSLNWKQSPLPRCTQWPGYLVNGETERKVDAVFHFMTYHPFTSHSSHSVLSTFGLLSRQAIPAPDQAPQPLQGANLVVAETHRLALG